MKKKERRAASLNQALVKNGLTLIIHNQNDFVGFTAIARADGTEIEGSVDWVAGYYNVGKPSLTNILWFCFATDRCETRGCGLSRGRFVHQCGATTEHAEDSSPARPVAVEATRP